MTELQAEVIVSLAKNRLNVSNVAKAMTYNRNTVIYHVNKIRETTGRDPLDFYDMCQLLPEAEDVLGVKEKKFSPIRDFYSGGYSDTFGAVLNCAVRYSIGRQTYMPGLVMDVIRPMLPELTLKTLAVFERDIAGAESYGAEFDEAAWMEFLYSVRKEIARRRGEHEAD